MHVDVISTKKTAYNFKTMSASTVSTVSTANGTVPTNPFGPADRPWVDLLNEAHIGDVIACISLTVALEALKVC